MDHHRIDLAASPVGPDPLAELLGGTDGVIHLAWTTGDGRAGGDVQPAGEANLRALRRVLRAAPATAVVHLSSATVYGAWNDNAVPLTEDLPLRPNPGFDFAVQKAEAERIVAEWSAGHPGASVCVLRPCVTLGVPGRPLYQALGGTRAPGTGDGARRVQFLHLDDLAAAVVFAWDHQLVGTFNVAPDSGTSDHVARALSGGWARLRLPERVARGLGRLGWHLWRSGVPRPAQPYNLHPWVVAPDRLVAAGWQARFSSEEALVATDDRAHWDDLPPGRRQELTLLAGAGGALALLAALATAARAWGRHHRRD